MEETLQYLLSQASGGAQVRRNREQMIEHLNSGDDTLQMQALFQLCDELNMASPIGLTTMQPQQLVGPIIGCLKKDYNPDLMLLASRALTYLADSLPRTLSILAESDNVNALLDPLRSMTEIELSEQCLTCLEKLSQSSEGARAIFQAGGIGALLMFIDFFTISSQRKAWTTIQRACRYVNDRNFDTLVDWLPAVRQSVANSDAAIRECAITSLALLARNVHNNPQRVVDVFNGLSDTLVSLTAASEFKSDSISTAVLSLIQVGVHFSAVVTRQLIESGVMQNLFALLDVFIGAPQPGSPLPEGSPPRSSSVSQSPSPAMRFSEAPSTSPAGAGGATSSPSSPGPKRAAATSTRPTTQQVACIASILSDTVGPNRDGLLAYVDTLLSLHQSSGDARAGDKSAGQSEDAEGEDDDDAEEDEEDAFEDEDDEEATAAPEAGVGSQPSALHDEESSTGPVAQRQRVAMSGVPLVLKPQRVNVGNHSCDGCGKSSLQPGDWYRCNQCQDTDYCGDCVQKVFKKHAGGRHAFTDVAVLLGAPAIASRCRPLAPSPVEVAKRAMFVEDPVLLRGLLEGMNTMINLATEAESAQVALPTSAFLASLFAQVSAHQLAACNLQNTKIHDAILAQLASQNLWANLFGVRLLSVVLDKLSEVMVPKLMREGVADALLQLRNTLVEGTDAADKAGSTATKSPSEEDLQKSLTELSGWRTAIAAECAQCLARFPALKDEKRAAQLQVVCDHLRSDRLREATVLLRDVLHGGTTTFELSSASLVQDLRQALVRANDIHALMTFMVALCEAPTTNAPAASADGPSALHLLVTHLQSMQSRMDEHLKVDNSTSPVEGMISLRLAPHEEENKTKGPAARVTTTADASRTGDAKGATASVSVDPFVTIGDLAEFIEQNLANRGDAASLAARGRRHLLNRVNEEESDGVENVLPDLNSSVNAAIRGKSFREALSPTSQSATNTSTAAGAGAQSSGAAAAPGRYWVRCGTNVLPPSMTVLQMMERFVRNKHGHQSEASVKPVMSANMRRQVGNEEATLFYSPDPFASTYKIVGGAARLPGLAVTTPLDVRVPSALQGPSSAAQTLQTLRNTFVCSKRFLTPAHQNVLALLGALHDALAHWSQLLVYTHPDLARNEETREEVLSPSIPFSEFESHKVNHKALRLCCNPRAAGLHTTSWPLNVELDAPFLFPASTREFFFDVAFCGTSRSLVRMQQYAAKHGASDRLMASQNARSQSRLTKSKKRVWRDHPLECAMDVLGDRRSSGSVVWEFQFYNEEGSGLGPTREFYTLVAQALRKRSLKLWLVDASVDGQTDDLVAPLQGLYPRPLPTGSPASAEMIKYYTFMGRFVARALLDGHVPSLALSPVFLRLIRGDVCSLSDVEAVQPSVYRVLRAIVDAVATKSTTLALGKNSCTVENLFLTFTLPGCDDVELVPGGANKEVTTANMGEYCDQVVSCLLGRCVQYAVLAFRAGFDQYMPVTALRTLTVNELFAAIHGNEEPITREELEANCKADHGFTATCKHVQWFYDIVAAFPLADQHKFFQFLTGAPHLPVGGLASLRPALTIVRKVATDQSVLEGEQLPSAMTCQNYLKLPAYDTKEQMEAKLRQAMEEGTGAFLLT